MAQWQGQFTGRTHATKVKDAEASWRVAIAALKTAPKDDRERKSQAVQQLGERLLAARLKMLRAQIESLTEALPPDAYPKQAQRLMTQERQTIDGGLDRLLAEFDTVGLAAATPIVD